MNKTVACPILLLFVVGCQSNEAKLADSIAEGNRLYQQDNYLGAERVLTAAISANPQDPIVAEAYYIRGLIRSKEATQVRLAEQDFLAAMRLTKRKDLKTNCETCIASIAYEKAEWTRAYQYYSMAAPDLPIVSPSDWVLYRLGVTAQKVGKWDEARKAFARLIRDFSQSDAAKLARKRISYDYFTIQAGVFTKPAGATERLKKLQQAALPAKIEQQTRDNGRCQVVCVGAYSDYDSALNALAKVKSVVDDAQIVP